MMFYNKDKFKARSVTLHYEYSEGILLNVQETMISQTQKIFHYTHENVLIKRRGENDYSSLICNKMWKKNHFNIMNSNGIFNVDS